jgi:hypothetical protein
MERSSGTPDERSLLRDRAAWQRQIRAEQTRQRHGGVGHQHHGAVSAHLRVQAGLRQNRTSVFPDARIAAAPASSDWHNPAPATAQAGTVRPTQPSDARLGILPRGGAGWSRCGEV